MDDIEIRPIEKDDYVELYELVNRNRLRLLMYFAKSVNTITDVDAAQKFTQLKLKQARNREQFYFFIVVKATSKIIGSIILKNIDWSVPKGELAYFIDAQFEGKGYSSDAVKCLVRYAFDELKMEKLSIKITPENWGSKKVAMKNGFEPECYCKREFRTGLGILTDIERYGLLR